MAEAALDPIILSALLTAALMHAAWNAVVRAGGDRFFSILLLSMTQSGLALLLLPFAPFPAPAAWPWMVGAALLHSGYKLFLVQAYEHGDLTQVYPLARGAAPPLVALVGLLLFGERLSAQGWLAVALIAGGVALMALRGGAGLAKLPPKALGYALVTACFVAAYTLADGQGVRVAHSTTGFTMWMFVIDGSALLAYAMLRRGVRAPAAVLGHWRTGLPAGALSLGSYWIAMWAFTRAPVALVAAMRETSVLIALLIGSVLLKEKMGPWRLAAGCCIGAGVIVLRL